MSKDCAKLAQTGIPRRGMPECSNMGVRQRCRSLRAKVPGLNGKDTGVPASSLLKHVGILVKDSTKDKGTL